MSETKRRTKNPDQASDDAGERPARRQTRVTLTKDVSSKYRKIMPKGPAKPAAGRKKSWAGEEDAAPAKRPYRKSGDEGSAPAKRTYRKSGEEGSAPAKRTYRKSGEEGFTAEKRPYRKSGEEGFAPAKRTYRKSGEEGFTAEKRPYRKSGEEGFTAEKRSYRKSGEEGFAPTKRPHRKADEGFSAEKRPYRKAAPTGSGFGDRRPAVKKTPAGSARDVAMKAIVNRELPEAVKQLREVQELIRTTAGEVLTLTESLGAIHEGLEKALITAAETHSHLTETIQPLTERTRQAQGAVTNLFEKMSFQDLAGQRLSKVDHFLAALTQVLGGHAPADADAAPRSTRKQAVSDDQPSELKGPQSAGEGLDQADIDSLLIAD